MKGWTLAVLGWLAVDRWAKVKLPTALAKFGPVRNCTQRDRASLHPIKHALVSTATYPTRAILCNGSTADASECPTAYIHIILHILPVSSVGNIRTRKAKMNQKFGYNVSLSRLIRLPRKYVSSSGNSTEEEIPLYQASLHSQCRQTPIA
jgi:hypothetical protein